MKVLIVEEALQKLDGHWFQYIRDIVDGGRAAGHTVEVLVHVDAHPTICETLGAHPVLQQSVWEGDSPSGFFKRLLAIRRHNRALTQDVADWLTAQDEEFDVTIFPTLRVDHVLACQKVSEYFAAGKVLGILAESPGYYDGAGELQFPRSATLFRSLLKATRRSVIFATESAGLQRQYLQFSETESHYLPHVTQAEVAPQVEKSEKPLYGSFGFTRYDKGPDVLHAALKESPLEGVEFVIQWTGDYKLPDGQKITRDAELEAAGVVRYLDQFTRSEEYSEWLARVDCMVLPYRKEFYWDKLSRVAIDAAQAGLPLIYPQGTWLAEFIEEYGAGVSFEAGDPDSLAEALQKCHGQFSELQALAAKRAPRARRDFSGAHFFECLTQILESK